MDACDSWCEKLAEQEWVAIDSESVAYVPPSTRHGRRGAGASNSAGPRAARPRRAAAAAAAAAGNGNETPVREDA